MAGNLAQSGNLRADGPSRARARALVAARGRSALDHHKITPGKRLFFSEDGAAFLAFQEAAGAAVVLGDPVGAPEAAAACVRAFLSRCRRARRAPVFIQTGGELLETYRRAGLSAVRIGADAHLDLGSFRRGAPAAKPLRHALRRAASAGLRLGHLAPPLSSATLARLREANESWLTLPGRVERGFSSGRFDERTLRDHAISLAELPGGRVAAFTDWIPSPVPGEATVDLIRRRADAPPGTLDALITAVLLEARDRGFDRFDLGLAPLARITPPFAHPAERVLARLFRAGPAVWGHRGLYRWKSKFGPRWAPRYLVYRGGPLAFARAALAVRRLSRREPPVVLPGAAPFAKRPSPRENDGLRLPTEAS